MSPKNNRKSKKSQRGRGKRAVYRSNTIPLSPSLVGPSGVTVCLKFIDTQTNGFQSTSQPFATLPFSLASPYFANQTYPTNQQTVSGLLEWGALYTSYRVMKVACHATICNTMTSPTYFGVGLLPSGRAASFSTWAAIMELMGNKLTSVKLVAAPGSNNLASIHHSHTLYDLEGRTEEGFRGDPGYAGTTNANGGTPTVPLKNPQLYTYQANFTITPNLTADSPTATTIEYWVHFSNLATLLS
jgi:hypothetical protein